MFCSKCGAAVPAGSAFCTSCGNPQGSAAMAPSPAVVVPPNVGVAGYSAGRGQFLYGDFWLRFVAYLIDSLIMGVAVIALFIPLAAITGAAAHLQTLGRLSSACTARSGDSCGSHFRDFYVCWGSDPDHVALSRVYGKFFVASHGGETSSQSLCDGPERPTDLIY